MKDRGRKQKLPGAIIRKLKSERGATLSMALLLFMVCAVVGGVILAAATASGGRLSQLAEMDQRYYSVTSAAKLLGKELSGKPVTVERTETTTTNYAGGSSTGVASTKEAEIKSSDNAILDELGCLLVLGVSNADAYSADEFLKPYSGHPQTSVIEMKVNHDNSLAIAGECKMEEDGTLTIKIHNENSEASKQYEVVLTFTAAITEGTRTIGPILDYNEGEIVSRTESTTVSTEITWNLSSIA